MDTRISEYEIVEKLYESRCTLVYRGHRLGSSEPVVLKILKPDAATEIGLARFRREFDITSKINLPGVVKTHKLEKYESTLMMVLEDIGGESLDRLWQRAPLSLPKFLELGIGVAGIVAGIHQQRIIHKNINPANIIITPETGQIRLIDFGLADELPQRNVAPQPPAALEGTLAYISPEQTGRMNRVVDYRTDFYSLGITLYDILIGKPPFEAGDALGMVHLHIAGTPVRPHLLDPRIPEMISRIVMKLVAKMAEDRYQSGRGLKADLEKCLAGLRSNGVIPDFELGLEDFSDRLQIPQKLYGRKKEVGRLLAAFERAAAGERELLLVAGYAGVGKTALVHETHRPVLEKRGYYIEGKFDPLQRNVPYFAWIQAFTELVNYILMESDAELAEWRLNILNAVRSSGRVLTDVIPSLEQVIGPQPAVPELGGTEAQNRFNYLFQEFVKVMATSGHPLVVFLDDLQWIDAASLSFLQMLLARGDINAFLLVGAYRDNEVDASHPLMKSVEELARAQVPVERLDLSPLSEEDVNALLSDALTCAKSDSWPLARLLHAKTDGNPFFMLQILRTLENEGLLAFDRTERRWNWDVNLIGMKGITDNVVDLMSQRVRQLPVATQQFLQRASCIGARFDLPTLGVVAEESAKATLAGLQTAFDEGLVIASGSDYRFVHDRVRQAAYSLIPDEARKAMHWKIGMRLLRESPLEVRDERFFDIVNHLNIGAPLFATQEEAAEVATLDCQAGRKAKASAAFAAAMDYFEAGFGLLGEADWEDRYQLMLALHQEATEAAGLCGRYNRMKELAAVSHQRARSLLDEVPTYETEIRSLTAQGELLPAIRLGLIAMERQGMCLPEEPTMSEVEEHMERALALLRGRTIEGLWNLPPMTAPERLACTTILSELGEPAYAASPQFFLVWASVMAELSLQYGNCALSPFAYAAYALALCASGRHIEMGACLAKAAIAMLEPLGAQSLRCRLLNIYGCTIQPWTEHLRDTLSTLQEAIDAGAESGDFTSGSYAAFNSCTAAFFMGEPLDKLAQRLPANMKTIAGMRQTYIWNWVAFHVLAIQRLRGTTDRPGELGSFDEDCWLASAREANDRCGLAYYFLTKLIICYLLGEDKPGESLEHLAEVKANQAGFQAAFAVPVSYFYGSLTLLKHGSIPQTADLDSIRENRKRLADLAHLAPMNFQHKCDLIAAELARVDGEQWQAVRLYEQAILGARRNGFLQEEAISCELAGSFYLERGMEDTAQHHIRRAHQGYASWQAWGKVRELETKHPQWLASQPRQDVDEEAGVLDLNTVMKATHAISSDMETSRLLRTIMRIIIENAGAQRGFLILETDGEWLIAARGEISAPEMEIPLPVRMDERELVASGVVRFVARTKERVVLDDAANQGNFVSDPYVRREKTKSLLCMPLLTRGRLIGVLHIENNLLTRAFTPARVQLLEMLLSQAAISLENARIYDDLRKSETKYRRIVDTANEGVWMLGPDAMTTFVNARMAEILGYSGEEMNGRPVTDFTFDEDVPDHLRKMENHRQGLSEHYERRFRRKDGQTIWTLASATPIFDEEHHFQGAFAMFTDITERKRAEEALRGREELLRQITAQVPGVVYQFYARPNGDRGLYYVSGRSEQIFGLKPDLDRFFERFTALVLPEYRAGFVASIEKVVREIGEWKYEGMLQKPSGETIWFSGNSIPSQRQDEIVFNGILSDITERKQAEQQLTLVDFAMNHVREAAFLIDEHAHFHYVNDEACRILGYTRMELLGLGVPDIDPDFPSERWPSHWNELMTGHSLTFEGRHRAKDGRIFPVEVNANYFEHNGQGYNLALVRDITERKQAEESLETERKRMENILSAQNTGLSLINPDMTIAWVNRKTREMFPVGEPVGQVCHVFYENRETICEGCGTLQAFVSGKVVESEQSVPTTNRWYYIISQPIKDSAGRVVNVLEGITDITERKHAEEALRKSETKYRCIVDTANEGIWVLGSDNMTTFVNTRMVAMLGYSGEEVNGRPIADFMFDEDAPDYLRKMENRRQGLSEHYERRFRRKDGQTIWTLASATPIFDEEHHFQGSFAMFTDITERKRAEEALKQRRDELERFERLTVGRELQMIELKKRIAELEQQHSRQE